MRRALLLVATALPAIALGQVPAPENTVVEIDNYNPLASPTTSYLNRAQCGDSGTNPQVRLEWNIPGANSGAYRLYATDQDPSTRSGDDQGFCLESGTTINGTDLFAGQIGESIAVATAVQQATVSGAEISDEASSKDPGAQKVCDVDGKTVWVCAHWYNTQTNARVGGAVGRFTVQLASPAAPSGVRVGSGPGSLVVRWSASTGGGIGADHYVATAQPVAADSDEPAAGAPTFSSSETNGTGPVEISGLTNGQRYRVQVVAFSVGGNPSEPSAPGFGTPTPVDGFWSVYENAGGQEQGGCGAGAAGPIALLGVAALLAGLRRRK